MTCEMDPRTPTPTPDTTRQAAEALVEDYERRVSTDLLERDWLVDQIATFAAAREAAGRERAVQALARVRRMRPGNICSEETNCTHARCCFHSGISYAADVIEEALRTPAPGAGTPWSDAPMDHTPAERAAGREGAAVALAEAYLAERDARWVWERAPDGSEAEWTARVRLDAACAALTRAEAAYRAARSAS